MKITATTIVDKIEAWSQILNREKGFKWIRWRNLRKKTIDQIYENLAELPKNILDEVKEIPFESTVATQDFNEGDNIWKFKVVGCNESIWYIEFGCNNVYEENCLWNSDKWDLITEHFLFEILNEKLYTHEYKIRTILEWHLIKALDSWYKIEDIAIARWCDIAWGRDATGYCVMINEDKYEYEYDEDEDEEEDEANYSWSYQKALLSPVIET